MGEMLENGRNAKEFDNQVSCFEGKKNDDL
mgnify:CR=1 FL=1